MIKFKVIETININKLYNLLYNLENVKKNNELIKLKPILLRLPRNIFIDRILRILIG